MLSPYAQRSEWSTSEIDPTTKINEKNIVSKDIYTIDIDQHHLNDQKDRKRKVSRSSYPFLWPCLCGVLLGALTCGLILAIIITLWLTSSAKTSTIAGSTLTSTLTTITSTTTSTTTSITSSTSTTTTGCILPYMQTSNGSCVNTMIDMNNCGTVGYICSTNYTSCSAGICSIAPLVQLPNATSVTKSTTSGGVNLDDVMFSVNLPFNITLYTTTTDLITVTSNGVLCLSACATTFTETSLPTSAFSGTTVFPFWDDLYIYAYTAQGIYYAVQGNAPNRTLVFEYYTSHFGQSTQYYRFQVIFFEDLPGIIEYKYFNASDGGVSCTVGVQASSTGPFIQYSYDLANSVQSNTTITFDTNLGIYINGTF